MDNWKTRIFYKGQCMYSFDKPCERIILWKVTSKCNQNCKYCFSTFQDNDIIDNQKKHSKFSYTKYKEVINNFKKIGVTKVYICGGEALLLDKISFIIEQLYYKSIKTYLITNLSVFPEHIYKVYCENKITSLSFSLDSIDKEINNYLRDNTDIIINNINKLTYLKKKFTLATKLGLGVVVSKKNVVHLKEIIDWALDINLNFVSLNLVYLPETHVYYKELFIRNEDYEYQLYLKMVDYLNSQVKGTTTLIPSNLTKVVPEFADKDVYIENCFCEKDFGYLFINSNGDVKVCPCKTNNTALGNIFNKSLFDIITSISNNENNICHDFSLQCLGIWESAYPKVNVK